MSVAINRCSGALFFVLLLSLANPLRAEVARMTMQEEDASDGDYLRTLRSVIANTQQTLDISVERILADREIQDPARQVLEDIIRTAQRGVRVRVFMNSYTADEEMSHLFLQEDLLAQMHRAGVGLHFVDSGYALQDRLVLADGQWVLEGGPDWSRHGLQKAFSSASLLNSEILADEKRRRLELLPLWDVASRRSAAEKGVIGVPLYLMKELRYLPSMVSHDDEDAMKIFLALLEHFYEAQDLVIEVDYEELTSRLPTDRYHERGRVVFQVIRALQRLQNEYGLIAIKEERPADMTLRLLLPQNIMPVIGLPLDFVHEQYAKNLSTRAIYTYLLIRYASQRSGLSPVWLGSEHNVMQDYPVQAQDFRLGVRELRNANLIEVFPFDLDPESAPPAADERETRYLINPIATMSERLEVWDRLRMQYEDRLFTRARELAQMLGESEDPKVVTVYLEWLKHYPVHDLKTLTQHVVSLRDRSTPETLDYLRTLLDYEIQKTYQVAVV